MSRFNESVLTSKKTTNHVGAVAFKQSSELELVSLMLSSFGDDSYYEKSPDTLIRLKDLIAKCDTKFAAQAAIYARTVFGMRTITHIVASELAKKLSGKEYSKSFYENIIHRPDDMLEILAYHTKKNGKVSNGMKKGFAKAFDKFNGYKLAKYRGEGKSFKLVDVVNMVHPIPNKNNKEALDALMKGTLKSFDTWEVELSKAGQQASSEEEKLNLKKDAWTKLIKERKIGYFALLRNLRNILEQAPEVIDEACLMLTDKKLIAGSLVLPFRYLSAYSEIEKLNTLKGFEKDLKSNKKVLETIEQAILLSIDNMPTLEGKTVILSDNSGSMRGDRGGASLVSRLSQTKTSDIANLFALLYWYKSDNTMMGMFGDKLLYPETNRKLGLFDNLKLVDKSAASVGPGTEAGIFEMFRRLIKEKIIANTIVIFSDCQIGDRCNWYGAGNRASDFSKLFSEYKKINPDFRCYSVDLRGYGTTVFDGSVIKIAGWSEKIFDIMKFAEQDKNALVNEIKKVFI